LAPIANAMSAFGGGAGEVPGEVPGIRAQRDLPPGRGRLPRQACC